MTLINIIFSSFFGLFFGGKAIVVFSSISLIASSIYLITIFHRKNQVEGFLNKKNILFLITAIIISSVSIFSILYIKG